MHDADGAGILKMTQAQLDQLRAQSEEERASLFAQLRAMTFDKAYYALFADHFLGWYRQRTGFIKSLVRSKSARKRWAKRRKQGKAKTGPRPNRVALRQVLGSPTRPLDRSKGRKKS
jgi:hypothetical protein